MGISRVSMKSGLEGRNNPDNLDDDLSIQDLVSMKSGLEGRNNGILDRLAPLNIDLSQ